MSERAETGAPARPPGGDGGGEFVRAILNVLEDSAEERKRLAEMQRAVLNVLDDAAAEKAYLESTQRAVLNVLDDAAREQERLAGTQRAVLNVLDDAAAEKAYLESTQRAVLNVLDDAAREQERLAETQRAVLNILDDFDLEKRKVEAANTALEAENEARRRAEEDERRARDAAERTSRELEAFSYSVAHDLRAPLRSIDGFSQALFEDYGDRFDGEAKIFFDHIRNSTRRMAQLIDDLLSLSRVSRAELKRAPVNLAALARAALDRLRAADSGREAEVALPERVDAYGDARLLGIVFDNLLGNAWKFTRHQPRPRIEFGAARTAAGTAYFVRDNGAGFDMAYAGKLFGVFQRLHSDKDFEGTGIGLVTVQRIVHRHGGRIWAEGEPGRGATFYFTLEGSA